jgi:ABC-2 type transport system permease protein
MTLGTYQMMKHEIRVITRDPAFLVFYYVIFPLVLVYFVTSALAWPFAERDRLLDDAEVHVDSALGGAGASLVTRMRQAHSNLRISTGDWSTAPHGATVIRIDTDRRATILLHPANPFVGTVLADLAVSGAGAGAVDAVTFGSRASRNLKLEPYGLTLPGFTVMFMFVAAGAVFSAFYREQWYGTWRRTMALPLHPWEVILGKMSVGALLSASQFGAMMVLGKLLFRVDFGHQPVLLCLLALLTAFCAASIGALITTLAANSMQAAVLTNLVTIVLASLSGAAVPLPLLPSFLRYIAPLTPQYWALEGLRTVMLQDATLLDISQEVCVLALLSSLAFLVSVRRLRLDKLVAI